MIVQFLKFGIVGVSNTLLAFAVYTLLLKVFGVWYIAASAIGFAVGAVNGFLLNRRWTFREHVGDALTPVRWAIVQGCGLGLQPRRCCTCSCTTRHWTSCSARSRATAIVTVLTFVANRAWTFRTPASVAFADGDSRRRSG